MKIKKKEVQKVYTYYKAGKLQEAKKEVQKLLLKDANNTTLLTLLAASHEALKEKEEAIECYTKILTINPNDFSVYNNLGLLYFNSYDFKSAESMYFKALKLNPNHATLYLNLGNLYLEKEEYKEAEQFYFKAIELGYNTYLIFFSLAKLYMALNKFEESQQMFQKTLELNPDNSDAMFELSLLYLKNKKYKEGFDLYRYRYADDKKDKQTFLLSKDNLLLKGIDIQGKIVLLRDEQGYGDMIQFIRYIPKFEAMGARVIVQSKRLLFSLFQENFPTVTFLQDQEMVTYDYHMPLLDAAYFFGTEYESIPFGNKYLSVNKDDSKKIAEIYFKDEKKKIGIVWRSNPVPNETLPKQRERESRNVTLEEFLLYFNKSEVQLYSLQVNVTDEERALLAQNNILSLGDDLVDFYDNALVIDNLDALIAIDTVSSIIAGVMGKETVILLSKNSDWRWGNDGSTTNWFKSVRLVRQTKRAQWETALKEASNIDGLLSSVHKTAKLMNTAMLFHQNGELDKAEMLYREVLQDDENYSDAYHYLGLIAYQTGHAEQAVALIKHALKLDPRSEEAFKNLESIIKQLQETPFIREYLTFEEGIFSIDKFAVRAINHNISEDEKKLIEKLKLELKTVHGDMLVNSLKKLYVGLLENSFDKALEIYLEESDQNDLLISKVKELHKILLLDEFELAAHELNVILNFYKRIFKRDFYETIPIKEQSEWIEIFYKFYAFSAQDFQPIFIDNVLPILKKYIKYNFDTCNVLKNKNDIVKIHDFLYRTSIYNPLFLNLNVKKFVEIELKELMGKAIGIRRKNLDNLHYSYHNIAMQWYTILRDNIDDTFIGSEYVLLINDTSDHYHPGCYMTSTGIKSMLLLKYKNIVDIPTHEIYSSGLLFDLTTAEKFDDDFNYRLFQAKLEIMDHKLSYAQEVVINGEGTLHGIFSQAMFILYLAYIAKIKYGKKVSIINHSPYPSYDADRNTAADLIYKKVYEKIDFTGIREPKAKEIMDVLNIESTLTFDCSSIYLNSLEKEKFLKIVSYDNYITISASVVIDDNIVEIFCKLVRNLLKQGENIVLLHGGPQEEGSFLAKIYKQFNDEKKVSFIQSSSVEDFISILKFSKLLISGRFHYSIISMFLQRPFILLNSNTTKNIGLIEITKLPQNVFNYSINNLEIVIHNEVVKILQEPSKYILSIKKLKNLEQLAMKNFI